MRSCEGGKSLGQSCFNLLGLEKNEKARNLFASSNSRCSIARRCQKLLHLMLFLTKYILYVVLHPVSLSLSVASPTKVLWAKPNMLHKPEFESSQQEKLIRDFASRSSKSTCKIVFCSLQVSFARYIRYIRIIWACQHRTLRTDHRRSLVDHHGQNWTIFDPGPFLDHWVLARRRPGLAGQPRHRGYLGIHFMFSYCLA